MIPPCAAGALHQGTPPQSGLGQRSEWSVRGCGLDGDPLRRWRCRNLPSSCPSCLRGGESRSETRTPCLSGRCPSVRDTTNRGAAILTTKTRRHEAGLMDQDRRWLPWSLGLKPIFQQVKAGEKRAAAFTERINRSATTRLRSCEARGRRWGGAGSVARPAPRIAGRDSYAADARPHAPPRSPARNPA